MLEHTFIHLRGIGPIGEARLWGRGFLTWHDISSRGEQDPIAKRARVAALESIVRLNRRDAPFFNGSLPSRERWRMYADFLDEAAFLDIETTGLSAADGAVTLVGLLCRTGYEAYVRGVNLDELPDALRRFRLFVTFNGAVFDLPFLEAEFGKWRGWPDVSFLAHAAHLDLRYPLRRLGHGGGLKAIERRLGLGRPYELTLLDGYDAVRLWRLHCDGEPAALDTLVRYNAEDVASLPQLARFVVEMLAQGTPMATRAVGPGPRIDRAALPYDPELVEFLSRGKRKLIGT